MKCCSYSLVTCNFISHVECFVILHWYFPKYVCRAQYGCSVILDFVLSRYVVNYFYHYHHHRLISALRSFTLALKDYFFCVSCTAMFSLGCPDSRVIWAAPPALYYYYYYYYYYLLQLGFHPVAVVMH